MGEAVLAIAHGGDDGQIAGGLGGPHGDLQLGQLREGLHVQQVRPGLPQGQDLLLEGIEGCLWGRVPLGGQGLAQGTYVPGDEDGPPGHLSHISQQLDRPEVEIPHLVAHAIGLKPGAAGPKGVGEQHIRPRRGVGRVDLGDPVGLADQQIFQALLAAHALGVEHGAHGPVHQQGAFGQFGQKWMHRANPSRRTDLEFGLR